MLRYRSPSLDYCSRLYDTVATEEGATFDMQSVLTKTRVHPRLCGGWWAPATQGDGEGGISEEVKDAAADALAAIMLACSYNGGVQKHLFFTALSKTPKELTLDSFVGALLLSHPVKTRPDALCERVHPGVYKAVGLSAAVSSSSSGSDEPPFDNVSQSAGSVKLSGLQGAGVSASSVQWLMNTMAETQADSISLDAEVYRAQLGYGKKVTIVPPALAPAPAPVEEKEGGDEGGEEKKGEREEAPAELEPSPGSGACTKVCRRD